MSEGVEKKVQKKELLGVACLVFSVAALVAIITIFFFSPSLTPDKKTFYSSIVLVFSVGFLAAIFFARGNQSSFMYFSVTGAILHALLLGLSIGQY